MIGKRQSGKTKPYLAPTQPEFPAQPMAEPPSASGGGKKPSSAVPSPGAVRKSQRGRYAVHEKRAPALDLQAAVKELSSPQPEVRAMAAKRLKAYAAGAEKARDVVSLLPPDSNKLISDVRAHCIAIMRKEIR